MIRFLRWLARLCPLALGRTQAQTVTRVALPYRTAVCQQLNALTPLVESDLAAKMTTRKSVDKPRSFAEWARKYEPEARRRA